MDEGMNIKRMFFLLYVAPAPVVYKSSWGEKKLEPYRFIACLMKISRYEPFAQVSALYFFLYAPEWNTYRVNYCMQERCAFMFIIYIQKYMFISLTQVLVIWLYLRTVKNMKPQLQFFVMRVW